MNPTVILVSCGHETYGLNGRPPQKGDAKFCEQCGKDVTVLGTRQAKTVELPPALREFIKEEK